MKDELFPKIKRSIENYLTEEEGNISRNKLLQIGSMVLLMGILFMQDAYAGHSSHSSHESHESHSSHSSGSGFSDHSSHSSGSGGSSDYTPSQATQAMTPTHEPMPSVPTPHIPPQNNFTTSATPPQQPDLTIPESPIITAAMILPEETSSN